MLIGKGNPKASVLATVPGETTTYGIRLALACSTCGARTFSSASDVLVRDGVSQGLRASRDRDGEYVGAWFGMLTRITHAFGGSLMVCELSASVAKAFRREKSGAFERTCVCAHCQISKPFR